MILFFLQVRFVMDDDTTLADLLALNLHNYEDQVLEIVDKATKEMAMEKVFTFLFCFKKVAFICAPTAVG